VLLSARVKVGYNMIGTPGSVKAKQSCMKLNMPFMLLLLLLLPRLSADIVECASNLLSMLPRQPVKVEEAAINRPAANLR